MQIAPVTSQLVASDIPPERLANNKTLTEQQKIAEASRQFEAILLRQILSATQKPIIPSRFADNSTAAQIYRDMVTTQLADNISKSGAFGLAQVFEKQLSRPEPAGPDHRTAPPAAHNPTRHSPGLLGRQAPGVKFLTHPDRVEDVPPTHE